MLPKNVKFKIIWSGLVNKGRKILNLFLPLLTKLSETKIINETTSNNFEFHIFGKHVC